jgi:6-hydroxy-3-succinoylpyridine 3-monooxygenase
MTLRTRVYVDGYNLYYGCVRKTAYKWLDIRALAAQILATIRHDVGPSDRGALARRSASI